MQKKYTSFGLMSGTSGDGVDASLIISDGENDMNQSKINTLSTTPTFLKTFII